MYTYTKLQPISADDYAAPQWIIQYQGDPLTDPEDIADELESGYEIDMHKVIGWEDYEHIIRTTDEHGETRYYLAG